MQSSFYRNNYNNFGNYKSYNYHPYFSYPYYPYQIKYNTNNTLNYNNENLKSGSISDIKQPNCKNETNNNQTHQQEKIFEFTNGKIKLFGYSFDAEDIFILAIAIFLIYEDSCDVLLLIILILIFLDNKFDILNSFSILEKLKF